MEGRFHARVRARSLNRFDGVAFVQGLQARWPESKLLVGSGTARPSTVPGPCVLFQETTTAAAANFVFERLPGYAPDPNSLDAGVWHPLKPPQKRRAGQRLRPRL